MPFPRRRNNKGGNTATELRHAPLPELTRQLLDDSIKNLTTILRTPESLFVPRRAKQSLADALKKLDLFYPVVVEVESADKAASEQVEYSEQRPGPRPVSGRPDGGPRQ